MSNPDDLEGDDIWGDSTAESKQGEGGGDKDKDKGDKDKDKGGSSSSGGDVQITEEGADSALHGSGAPLLALAIALLHPTAAAAARSFKLGSSDRLAVGSSN